MLWTLQARAFRRLRLEESWQAGLAGIGNPLVARLGQTLPNRYHGCQRATPQQRKAEAGCPELHAAPLVPRNLCYPHAGLGALLLFGQSCSSSSSCASTAGPIVCLLEKKFLHLSILRDFLEARIYKVAKIIGPVMPFVWLRDGTLEVETVNPMLLFQDDRTIRHHCMVSLHHVKLTLVIRGIWKTVSTAALAAGTDRHTGTCSPQCRGFSPFFEAASCDPGSTAESFTGTLLLCSVWCPLQFHRPQLNLFDTWHVVFHHLVLLNFA